MSRDSRMKLAGITAAVTATAAAGYYAYDQYTKRYPKYQEQLDMYSEVGVLSVLGKVAVSCYARWCRSSQYQACAICSYVV
jgi:hypothetical protein